MKRTKWHELMNIMNQYMIEKNCTKTDALNFMKVVLITTAKVTAVKKHIFDKQCDSMKVEFENIFAFPSEKCDKNED